MADKRQTLTIRYATSADSDRLTDFRISQFKTAKEFELAKPELLSKQSGFIFIVEEEGILVSTMQLNVVTHQDYFNNLSISGKQIADRLQSSHLPTIYLSKAATTKQLRNSGLNSYLRLISIKKAISSNINSLTGVAFEHAPRLHLLEKLGYKFSEIEMSSTDYVLPKGKSFFLLLEQKYFLMAKEKLEKEVIELEEQYIILNQTEPTWSPSYQP